MCRNLDTQFPPSCTGLARYDQLKCIPVPDDPTNWMQFTIHPDVHTNFTPVLYAWVCIFGK